ncbi:MAG: ATP-dependent DNA helicase [Armatimonadota bacterium]
MISSNLPGYEYRPQQVEAALGIERALHERKHCLVEAGTGVGKSMAYLLAAVEHARAGKKVVVSTQTLNLQAQLAGKDIPFLQSVLPGRDFKVVVAKGRGNYLCLSSFDAELGQLYLASDPNTARLSKWVNETETGDVAELDFSFSGWSDICSNLDTCHNQECRYFSKCFYYKMRKAATEADIVVTNHFLFMSDLAIRSSDSNAGILPDYDAVIFDEAHHLEDVAIKVFGVELASFRLPNLIAKLRRVRGVGLSPERLKSLDELNSALFSIFYGTRKQDFFFSDIEGADRVGEVAEQLGSVLDGLVRELAEQVGDRPELRERLEGLQRICVRCREEIMLLFFGPPEGHFRWGQKDPQNCYLRYTPLSVAEVLRDLLWKEIDSVILTSATLANSGTFRYVKSRLGIPEALEVIQESPFDFRRQCMLYVPRHLDFPTDSPDYADSVADEMEGLVAASDGRAFLLFTSYRMMNAIYERLLGRLPYVMLKQGEMSNEALLQTFLREEKACLFGVHSFWEGVDVRGEALSCVVIDKLPFAVPDSAVNRARVDAITGSGGDWFREYSMPQAQMRLKQGFGRLIRTAKDRGVVAILDARLVKKYYGREFLRFLPKCPVTHKLEDVRRFFGHEEFILPKHS